MKTTAICFSENGARLLKRIRTILKQNPSSEEDSIRLFRKSSSGRLHNDPEIEDLTESLHDWTGTWFSRTDVLIFVGACGIAVRAIAPFVRDKRSDPAVLVLDDRGMFCISLLSGHIGGANAVTFLLADGLGSTPVITTATDIYDKFAVDLYAEKHGLTMSNMTYAKEVSAAVVSGEPVGFYTHFPVIGNLPEGLVWSDKLDAAMEENGERPDGISLGIYISPSYNRAYFDHTLWLIPKCLSIGIGCRKGTDSGTIASLVRKTLNSYSLYQEAIRSVATIDRKAEEPGLVEYCSSIGVPLHAFSAEELSRVPGEFTASDFVEQVTGVDNVCERSALLDSSGKLIISKTAEDGVTCAVAITDWKVEFT